MQHWPNGVKVYFNTRNSKASLERVEEVLAYVTWLVKERTGIDVSYGGTTELELMDGAIVMMWANIDKFEEYNFTWEDYAKVRGFATRWGSPYTKAFIGLSDVYINATLARSSIYTILHEVCHCLGVSHSETKDSLMAPSQSWTTPDWYGMTVEDMMALDRGGNHSFVDLTLEYDLFIPWVEDQTAHLEYIGDKINDHRWKLRHLREAGPISVPSNIEPVNPAHPSLVLNDVRRHDVKLTNVKLDYDLETEEWSLVYADYA